MNVGLMAPVARAIQPYLAALVAGVVIIAAVPWISTVAL